MQLALRQLAKMPLCLAAGLTLSACEVAPGDNQAAADKVAHDPFADQADFFPLGVFLQSPHRAEQWASLGINLIVHANGFVTMDDVVRMNELGIQLVGNERDRLPLDQMDGLVPLYLGKDEPDNAQRRADGTFGPCLSPTQLADESELLTTIGQGRPIFRNFGRGIVNPDWKGRGECSGQTDDYYPAAIASADIVSFDYYPVMEGEALSQVAKGSRSLAAYIEQAGGNQGQWGIIEASAIRDGAIPTPAQIRSMAWMHIINGARGLVFFPWQVDEKGARIREDAAFANQETVDGIAKLTAELTSLAPAIKSARPAKVSAKSALPVSTMARRHDNAIYIFAVSESGRHGETRFTIPAGAGQLVEVVGEDRVLTLDGDSFTDQFAPYAAHVYRISGIDEGLS